MGSVTKYADTNVGTIYATRDVSSWFVGGDADGATGASSTTGLASSASIALTVPVGTAGCDGVARTAVAWNTCGTAGHHAGAGVLGAAFGFGGCWLAVLGLAVL